jgi:hypothetical protein
MRGRKRVKEWKKVVSLFESFSLIVIAALFSSFSRVSIYTNINRPYGELTPQTCDSHVWDSSFFSLAFLNWNCFFTQQQIVKQ